MKLKQAKCKLLKINADADVSRQKIERKYKEETVKNKVLRAIVAETDPSKYVRMRELSDKKLAMGEELRKTLRYDRRLVDTLKEGSDCVHESERTLKVISRITRMLPSTMKRVVSFWKWRWMMKEMLALYPREGRSPAMLYLKLVI